jgi:hypothetical protein
MNDDERYRAMASKLVSESEGPSSALEQNVVDQLMRDGKLTVPKTSTIRPWMQVLAAAAIFIAGFGTAFLFQVPSKTTGEEYMLLLFDGEHFNPPNRASLRTAYGEWMRGIRGVEIVAGEELQSEGMLVGNEDSSLRDRASGFFILRASSRDKIVEIAKTSPHARYGGIVEIKKVLQ